jgi:GTPase
VLVGIQLPGETDEDHEADLAELGRLVRTLGYEVVGTITQRRDALSSAAVLGEGKLKELAALTGGTGVVGTGAKPVKSKARERLRPRDADGAVSHDEDADEADDESRASPPDDKPTVVVVDHEISPSQARNLERATGARVLDRTGVIIDIFHHHARSRAARAEVEIARLNYVAPRLREAGGSSERQRGRGAGQAALELDRRRIRDRLAELRTELDALAKEDANRRALRQGQLRVALVGYTNAGKSSLMRGLTGSDVLVEDKLFATLDTTIRALSPETKPRILVSDTVGFIKKLPHDLVASFRSTLDEALEASLLCHVVDAADLACDTQVEVTRKVLAEIGASAVPTLLVLNKVDRTDEPTRARLRRVYGDDAIFVSAHDQASVHALRDRITLFFEQTMVEAEIVVPYDAQAKMGHVYVLARVISVDYDDAGARMTVRGVKSAIDRLHAAFPH